MDQLQAIKERIDHVSHFEWAASSFKSRDIFWLINTVEEQREKISEYQQLNINQAGQIAKWVSRSVLVQVEKMDIIHQLNEAKATIKELKAKSSCQKYLRAEVENLKFAQKIADLERNEIYISKPTMGC